MPSIRSSLLLRASAVLLVAVPAATTAQTLAREGARQDSAAGVPRGMMPPSGKCRVWMDGVPATRQPAPTDCATALRHKPANARVIYGPNTTDQRQAGLDAARDGKRSLLTPIGERRPALAQDTPREATKTPRAAPPAPRTQATVRQPTTPVTSAPPPKAPPAPPPKKPERP